MTVTSVPKRLKMDANSTPTAPAPIIARLFGTAVRFRISILVRMNSASGSRPGSMRASDPVAMMMFLASSVCAPASDFTSTLPPPFSVANPAIRSTFARFSRNSTPLACLLTIPSLRSFTLG